MPLSTPASLTALTPAASSRRDLIACSMLGLGASATAAAARALLAFCSAASAAAHAAMSSYLDQTTHPRLAGIVQGPPSTVSVGGGASRRDLGISIPPCAAWSAASSTTDTRAAGPGIQRRGRAMARRGRGGTSWPFALGSCASLAATWPWLGADPGICSCRLPWHRPAHPNPARGGTGGILPRPPRACMLPGRCRLPLPRPSG